MRAYVITDFGATPELADVAVPEPAEGEVRVHVHAASVNGFDTAVANSYLKGMMEHRFPVVLGKDFAGVVDAVGADVTGYRVGDRVFGVVTKDYLGDGSFAEYVTVPVAVGIANLPDRIDFVEGATLGLAGAAALGVIDAAELKPGQTVLVSGATGGVGNQAVQLAAEAGAHVIATASTEAEKALVTGLGAEHVVDYAGDVAAAVHALVPDGVDAIIHLAGDPQSLLPALRSGGRLVSTLVSPVNELATDERAVIGIYANPDAATLDRLTAHRSDGTTTVEVQETFPLDQAHAALAAFASGTLGKVVIITTV